jgi:hypothetical protein
MLSQEQYASLWNTFQENIWIFVSNSPESMFGVGLSLVFEDADVYSIFASLAPAGFEFIEWLVGSGKVDMQTNENSIRYSTKSIMTWSSMDVASIVKSDETTTISLLWWWLLQGTLSAKDVPIYTDETAVVFRANLSQLSTLSALAWVQQIPSGLLSWQQWILVGDIQSSQRKQQITFSFSVKQ